MKSLGVVVMVLMASALVYGFTSGGGFFDGGGELVALPWGRVTIVDLYLALALFGAWIVRRDGWKRSLPWLVGLVVGGSLVAGLYLVTRAERPSNQAT